LSSKGDIIAFSPKTPHLTVDGIIQVYDGHTFKGIVLIERKYKPKGIALPGGFVDYGEQLEDALVREMKEETTLDVKISYLQNIYSDPDRDERMHTASAVYVCTASGIPKGEDDAKEAKVYALNEIPLDELVFDHKQIIEDYLLTKDRDHTVCALCGRPNLCKAGIDDTNCWCDDKAVVIPVGLKNKLPFTMQHQNCICQECIDAYNKKGI
jgi:8-oxo-dGTP diphosphatase